jgi:uncharacterized protein (TIGR02145 family)
MKRFYLIFITASLFVSCKKEASSTNMNSGGTKSDTTNIINQPLSGYGPNITDIDGNSYKTVYIGKQHWMAENLKVTKYNDGSGIPNITDNAEWSKLSTGAWSYYNNDVANNVKYGKLYNWYAVSSTTNGNKNVCPTGWHLPTYNEWKVLTEYLGGDIVAGSKMKEVGTVNWKNPNNEATNSSLFSGLPGGVRIESGSYDDFNDNGNWFSLTLDPTFNLPILISLNYFNGKTVFGYSSKNLGCYVRCLKD